MIHFRLQFVRLYLSFISKLLLVSTISRMVFGQPKIVTNFAITDLVSLLTSSKFTVTAVEHVRVMSVLSAIGQLAHLPT